MMEVICLIALIIVIIIVIVSLSCNKATNAPSSTQGGSDHQQSGTVTNSSWFPPQNVNGNEVIVSVPELTEDIIYNGRVLVFLTDETGSGTPTILPSIFNGDYISVGAADSELTIFCQGAVSIFNSLRFRYILIPQTKLVPSNVLDYTNYGAVCSYYNIPN